MKISTPPKLPFQPLLDLVEPALAMTKQFLADYPDGETYSKGQVDDALDRFSHQFAPAHEKCVVPHVNSQQWSKYCAPAQKTAAQFKCLITGTRVGAGTFVGCHICSKGILKDGRASKAGKTCFAPGCPAIQSVNTSHSAARRHGDLAKAIYISALMVAALDKNKHVVDDHLKAAKPIIEGRGRGRPRRKTKTPSTPSTPPPLPPLRPTAGAKVGDESTAAAAARLTKASEVFDKRQSEYVEAVLTGDEEFGLSRGSVRNAMRLRDRKSCENLALDCRATLDEIVDVMKLLPGFDDSRMTPNEPPTPA